MTTNHDGTTSDQSGGASISSDLDPFIPPHNLTSLSIGSVLPAGRTHNPSTLTSSSLAGESAVSATLPHASTNHRDCDKSLPSDRSFDVVLQAGDLPPANDGVRASLVNSSNQQPAISRLQSPVSGRTDLHSELDARDHRKSACSDVSSSDSLPTATTPGPLREQQDDSDPHPFSFKPAQLSDLVDPKNLESLEAMGGVSELLNGLSTHQTLGLGESADAHLVDNEISRDSYSISFDERRRVYGTNIVPARPSKTIWQLMWIAFSQKVLILLSISAVVSLALGLFQTFGPVEREPGEPPIEWVEGVAIFATIGIAVGVDSLMNFQKERQFRALNAKKDERFVKVIRGGAERQISVHDVVVGDIALLEPGEIIPCDGVFLSGYNVRCDESGATGESDVIKKIPYEDCIRARDRKRRESGDMKIAGVSSLGHTDCFLISGSKVLEGVGSYLVIAVGTRSFSGRIMIALRTEDEATPLQRKINRLADIIALVGVLCGTALFGGLLIRFFVDIARNDPPSSATERGIAFANILILAVTLIVASVPEGLPLAISLALALATKRMTRENLLVRVLSSCETMANATVVCTDKTGTLTQNEMTVVAGLVGLRSKFVRELDHHAGRANITAEADRVFDLADLDSILSPTFRDLLNDSIAVNSTAFEDEDPDGGGVYFVGNKTEAALLRMARDLGWPDYKTVRESAEVLQVIPFSSERKAMGIVVRLSNGRARLFIKGASEILAALCARHATVNDQDPLSYVEEKGIMTEALASRDRETLFGDISFYASQTLRTISLCYRDFESWPPAGISAESDEVPYEVLSKDLTLIAVTAIEDPLRPGVRQAIADCSRAGVQVKMCTGDNVLTAKSIAQQCGIYTIGGIVMEGPHFRSLSNFGRRQIVPRLQVLARSSPEDKRLLVNTLKELDEIVGVTGDGTNDGPALKAAHVGFSMGIAGTEVAKEASNIVLMDDNFASIVKAVMWGRTVNDAVRKFLQFQISVNVIAVVVTLVSGIASDNEHSVLTAVQLLWINIIMDTFAAVALATDPASPALLNRKPSKQSAPLFSVDMLKQIVGQSIYQIIVVLIFHFFGHRMLGYESGDARVSTLVFNAFVFAQIFNSFNCRRLDRGINIFEGLRRNPYFVVITLIEIGAQVLIVFFGGAVFNVKRIGGREWGISVALGIATLPVGLLVRLIPNEPCESLFTFCRLYRPSSLLPNARESTNEPGLDYALDKLHGDVETFHTVRGGRARIPAVLSKVFRRRKARGPGVASGLLTMVPSLIGAHIVGSNWNSQKVDKGALADGEKRFEIHPDTPKDDAIFGLLRTSV